MITISLAVVPVLSSSSSNRTTTQLAFAQTAAGGAAVATTNDTSELQEPGQPNLESLKSLLTTLQNPTSQVDVKMSQLSSSNKPGDIATLAYIWDFRLLQ
jgi:hypothetical protein